MYKRQTQTLDLTSESNGCQAVLQKAVGDAMTLYLSVAVTYPEGVDLSASLPLAQTSGSGSYGTTSVVVTEGTVTDPGQMPAESDLEGLSGVGLQSSQMGDHTLQYLITLHFQDAVLTPGRDVTLLFADQLGDNTHLFHWTVENQAPVQQAELAADDGTVVGTGVFSPFAACLTFPDGSLLTTEADRLLEELAFLDPVSYTHLDVYKRQKQQRPKLSDLPYTLSFLSLFSLFKKGTAAIWEVAAVSFCLLSLWKNTCLLYTSRCV